MTYATSVRRQPAVDPPLGGDPAISTSASVLCVAGPAIAPNPDALLAAVIARTELAEAVDDDVVDKLRANATANRS